MLRIKLISLTLLLFFIFPIASYAQKGNMNFSTPDRTKSDGIPIDEAEYVFVSSRKDLVIDTKNPLDKVSPLPRPIGGNYEYIVRLKLKNGVDYIRERNFTLTVKNTTISEIHKNKSLTGGCRYRVNVEVVDLSIESRPIKEGHHMSETEAMVVFQTKLDLEIKAENLAHNISTKSSKSKSGLNLYEVTIQAKDVEKESKLLVKLKNRSSNEVEIDVSDLGLRDKRQYEIKAVEDLKIDDTKFGWIQFTVNPPSANARIQLNNGLSKSVENGELAQYLEYGLYDYTVSAQDYHLYSGQVLLNGDKVKEVVNLAANYGSLSILGTQIADAVIYIDKKEMGKASQSGFEVSRITSGKHRVMVVKEMYKSYETMINIEDGKKLILRPQLSPNYAHITFKVANNADILINNKKVGAGTAVVDLVEGAMVQVICRKDYHRVTKKEVLPVAGESRTIVLDPPIPIYGSVNIQSTPLDARVYVDDTLQKEKTPSKFTVLTGPHKIVVQKDGYADYEEVVTIEEHKQKEISAKLVSAQKVTFNITGTKLNSSKATIYCDGRKLGGPGSYYLAVGQHNVSVTADGYHEWLTSFSVPRNEPLNIVMLQKKYSIIFSITTPNVILYIDDIKQQVANGCHELTYGKHKIKATSTEGCYSDFEDEFILTDLSYDNQYKNGYIISLKKDKKKVAKQEHAKQVEENKLARDRRRQNRFDSRSDLYKFTIDFNGAVNFDGIKDVKDIPNINLDNAGDTWLGATMAGYGKRNWGFYISGYTNINNFNEWVVPIGLIRRFGNNNNSMDFQLYGGAGLAFDARNLNINRISSNDIVYDFGIRFLTSHNALWHISMGGMYTNERLFGTLGLSFGFALPAAMLIALSVLEVN